MRVCGVMGSKIKQISKTRGDKIELRKENLLWSMWSERKRKKCF